MSTSSRSKGGKWIAAILGRQPEKGEKVDLIGKPCLVHVYDKEGWPAVDAVLPPLKEAELAPAKLEAAMAGTLPELP